MHPTAGVLAVRQPPIEQREIDPYVARAAGGAGLIITGPNTVTRVPESTVARADSKGRSQSAPADMVINADGTTAAASLARWLVATLIGEGRR